MFVDRRPADIQKLLTHVIDFEHRAKWRHLLQDEALSVRKFNIKKPPTPCHRVVPMELVAWLGELRKSVFAAAEKAKKIWLLKRPPPPVLLNLAWDMFERYGLVAIPTDKDGGFTILGKQRKHLELQKLMAGHEYEEMHPQSLQTQQLKQEYHKLCSDIVKLEQERGLYNALVSSWADNQTVANIMLNCKSHKDPVEFRNIHSAPKSAFNGLSSYLNIKFGRQLKQFPHLIKDSLHLVKELTQMECDGNEIFYQLDVKSFFMSGLSHELSNSCDQIFYSPDRDILSRVVFWLLDNQFVRVREMPGRLWKVKCGTGMGLKHSGEVADASFYTLHEKHVLDRLLDFGIKAYWRFKDDILIIGSSRELAGRFVSELKGVDAHGNVIRPSPFKIKCEAVSKHRVEFLELVIWKGQGRFEYAPRFKSTALNVPKLNHESAHWSSVHRTWPIGFLRKKLLLTRSVNQKRKIKAQVIQSFKQSHAPLQLIQSLEKVPLLLSVRSFTRPHMSKDALWLVLEYHPSFEKERLAQHVKAAWCEEHMVELLAFCFPSRPEVRISWKRTSPNLSELMRMRM